jgi:hypothetical protein
MVIASSEFRDEEYQKPRALLEKSGVKVTVASSTLKESKGMLGLKVKPDILLKDAQAEEYDGIVFVGGGDAKDRLDLIADEPLDGAFVSTDHLRHRFKEPGHDRPHLLGVQSFGHGRAAAEIGEHDGDDLALLRG